jgi:hypothetical protein
MMAPNGSPGSVVDGASALRSHRSGVSGNRYRNLSDAEMREVDVRTSGDGAVGESAGVGLHERVSPGKVSYSSSRSGVSPGRVDPRDLRRPKLRY